VSIALQTGGVRAEYSHCAKNGDSSVVIGRAHSAEAPWPLKGFLPFLFYSLPFTYNRRKVFYPQCRNFYNSDKFFHMDSDPVYLLSTGSRAEFAPSDKQSTGLSHKHTAILAANQLSLPATAGGNARATRPGRRKKPPDKANYQESYYGIKYKSEKHCSQQTTLCLIDSPSMRQPGYSITPLEC
jgi:hypothetical protein